MKNLKYYLLVLLIVIIGTFLRFFMITDKSFWFDEGYSLYYSDGHNIQESISKLTNNKTGDRFQALYYLLLFCWRQAFGGNEFAVRSLSAFLGVGAVIILFYTALRIYGKKHAFWSALLLSTSSYGVYYSQQARAYTLLLFLALLQLFFFSKALNEEEQSHEAASRWSFWIVTGFGLSCSTLIGLFSAALSLSHILVYRNFKRWLQWWVPATIFCIPAILFYLSSPVATDPAKVVVTPLRQSLIQNILFVVYGLLIGETYGPPIESLRGGDKIRILLNYLPQLLILLIVATTIFLSLLIGFRNRSNYPEKQRADRFFISLLILSFFIAFIFAVVTKFNWLPRHSFYIYIPLVFLLPSVLREKYRREFRWLFQYARIAFITLVFMNLYSIYNYYFNPVYARENYRLAAQYLLANNGPSQKTVLLFGSERLLRQYGDTVTLNATLVKGANIAKKVSNLTNGTNTVIVAVNYESIWQWKSKTSVERAMQDLYVLQSKVSFTNFNMYYFVKKQ